MPAKKKATKKTATPAAKPAASPEDKARSAIERALKKNAGASNEDLRKVAVRQDPSIAELNPRSFNARFALGAKRKLGLMKVTRRKKRGSGPVPRKKRAARSKAGGVAPIATRKKRGPGRPRKTAARRGRPARGMGAARRLVFERDQLAATTLNSNDANAAYDLASSVDEFIERVLKAAAG